MFRTVLEKCKYKKLEDSKKKRNSNCTNITESSSIQLTKKYSLFPTSSTFKKGETDVTKDLRFAIDDDLIFGTDLSTVPRILDEEDDDFGEMDMMRGSSRGGDDMNNDDDENSDSEADTDFNFNEFERTNTKEYRILAKDVINTVFNVVSNYRGDQGVR